MLKTSLLSLATAVVLITTGCGGGSGGSSGDSDVSGITYSGIGIDGILMGSTVCIDADESGTCDQGEPSTETDADGKFTISATTVTGPLLLLGGVDKSTGEDFKGVLKAPAGSKVVTPLTSAIQSMVEGGKSAADAEATIKTAMGLDDVNVSLTSFDPYNGIETDPVNAQKILAKQTQLQVLVHTAAATIAGADAGTNVDDAMSNVFDAIVDSLDTGAEVELDAQAVAIATREAAAKTYDSKSEAEKNALVVAIGTVAEEEAEAAVSAANGAEKAISDGEAKDAIGALDGAINEVNKEDGAAAATAKASQPEDADTLADIIAVRKAEDAAAKLTAKKEAEAVAARLAADEALEDAETKAELEAAEKLRAAAAEAEKLAAEKAAAEAQAAVLAAEKEVAIDAEKAAKARLAAEAAKAAADAAALQAEIEAEAAEAAALAIADAKATELAELMAAAKAAALKAEQLRAEDLIKSYIATANNAAANAQASADAVEVISAGYSVDANLTIANEAASQAQTIATDLNNSSETNTTIAQEKKDNVLEQAKIAADALKAAQEIKSAVDIATAIINGQKDRIAIIAADINTTANNAMNLFDKNGSKIQAQVNTDWNDIKIIVSSYPDDTQSLFNEANASYYKADDIYYEANTSIGIMFTAYQNVLTAATDINETAANAAKVIADAEKAKIAGYLTAANAEAKKIAGFLVTAEGIRNTAIANEQARVEAAILASKKLATDSLALINTSATEARASATKARADVNAIMLIVDNIKEIQVHADGAAAAASTAEEAASTAEALAIDALTHKNDTDAATTEEVAAVQAGFVQIKVEPATLAATTATQAATAASEALAMAQALVANYEIEGKSINVEDGISSLEALTVDDSLTNTLATIKSSLGTTNKDEKVFAAFIDIIDIVNSDGVTDLLDKTGTRPNLDILVDENATDIIGLASTATMLGGTEVMHEMATKLKSASDVIEAAFENSAKVISYSDITINYDDSLAIRGAALAAASALDLFSSYTYGDIDYFLTKEKTIDGVSYEYIQSDVDPLAMLTQPTFFKMSNTSRLAGAGVYLKTAADLISSIDITKVTASDINETDIVDANNIKTAFEGNGILEIPSHNDVKSIDVKKIFSSTDFIDREDFDLPTEYLGKSDEAIAEYDRAVGYKEDRLVYDVAQCEDYNASRVEPTDDIDWSLVWYSEETTPVMLNTDLTIKYGLPVYRETTMPNSWVDYNNNCAVINYSHGHSDFHADFAPTFKESLKEVVVIRDLASYIYEDAVFYNMLNPKLTDSFNLAKISIGANNTIVRIKYNSTPEEEGAVIESGITYTIDRNTMIIDVPAMDSIPASRKHFKLDWRNEYEIGFYVDNDINQDGTIDETRYEYWLFDEPRK